MMNKEKLYNVTPLLENKPIGKKCGVPVYLKMENMQFSGSFKMRGISNLITKSVKQQGITKLVSASGGNAGMATACSGKLLQIPTTIVIPESTPKLMITKLEDEGSSVQVVGRNWNEAQKKALELSKEDSTLYVHPYEHPLIWEGHASIVEEIVEQCPLPLSAIVVSVGGGGLLCGVLQGLQNKGLKIPVVALETDGAHCFNAALKSGKPVSIGEITSLAKTLGALSVTPHVFDLLPQSEVISEVVKDKEAVQACLQFVDDGLCLVEPSCGAALSAAYSGLISRLVQEGRIKKGGAVVFIVCGGNGVTLDLLREWQKVVGL